MVPLQRSTAEIARGRDDNNFLGLSGGQVGKVPRYPVCTSVLARHGRCIRDYAIRIVIRKQNCRMLPVGGSPMVAAGLACEH
jgi:hypothetical protein